MIFQFEDLEGAPLVPGATYRGGTDQGIAGEVLHRLIPGIKNSGGIRYSGNWKSPNLIILTSSVGHRVWPDRLSVDGRYLKYFGDNKKSGNVARDSSGNRAILSAYEILHQSRSSFPPLLYFVSTGNGFDQKFIGLFALGEPFTQPFEWVSTGLFESPNGWIENLVIRLSRLESGEISKDWIINCIESGPTNLGAPSSWKRWINDAIYQVSAPNFNLASEITSLNVEQIGESFLRICLQDFPGNSSMLAWLAAASMLHSSGISVTDVKKKANSDKYEISIANSSSGAFMNQTNLPKIEMSILNDRNKTLDFRFEMKLLGEDNQDGPLVFSKLEIGIEIDRLGIKDSDGLRNLINQILA